MRSPAPNFSPFPWSALRRVTRRAAAFESALARGLAATPPPDALAPLVTLLGAPVDLQLVGVVEAGHADPHAARCEVRVSGARLEVAGASRGVRALAQHLLGGPRELDAPRPLTEVESAIWCGVVAAGLEAAGIAGEVWLADPGVAGPERPIYVEVVLASSVLGPSGSLTVVVAVPPALVAHVPRRPRTEPSPRLAGRIVVARAPLDAADLAALTVRDVVTVERSLGLVLGETMIALAAAPGAVVATVASEYVPRAMAVADDARVELTVELGSTELSLRELGELAVGSIVPLGRPLAGPFELRVAGKPIGSGELIDVEGELGVRITSLRSS